MSKDKNILDTLDLNHSEAEEIGDNHLSTSVQTPLRKDAFELTDSEKIEVIEKHFAEIMHALGLDLTDESLSGTPRRVAKMYVKEIFQGLNPVNRPDTRKFGNKYEYGDMVVVKNINVTSFCEHHFLPFIGKAHVAYFSSGKVIGLSKINRMVDYYARRPQVQERLTLQIAEELQESLETDDVAVFIESKHFCVSTRGIQDRESSTVTTEYRGRFKEKEIQQRFIDYMKAEMMV
ncbi:GTP cyclohydrolase I FolE [Rhodohalobacter mucosus]|uniref:GTP cyclohydrolase 1 n=1 Tax=Rhodohalobacter mucosus TaxID=2079485 RepID=A0A316TQJ3_9BACT|nr:GTP cyclohydrolase I FolE [Rhodohalobacter mucosus]PWN06877.1 GTP cyclohydrolase I FolE [Rhodohalobacter mucosus]